MEITIKVPDQLAAEAQTRGVPVQAYVEEILARQVVTGQQAARSPRTPEEIKAWLESLSQFSEKIPPLPEQISREWIYQDHD